MRNNDQKSMSIRELRKLYKEVTIKFDQKLWLEEIELEQRLRQLQEADNIPTGLRRFDA